MRAIQGLGEKKMNSPFITFILTEQRSLYIHLLFQILLSLHLQLSESKERKGKWSPQSCPTLCDPMDCSISGSSIHGIFQARVLEWVAIAFSEKKHLLLLYWLCQTLWLCGSQQTVKILQEMGIPDHLTCLLRHLYADQEAIVRTGHWKESFPRQVDKKSRGPQGERGL